MNMTSVLIIGGVIAFVLLVIGLVISTREETKLVAERLDRFTEAAQVTAVPTKPTVSPIAEFLTSLATRFAWGQNLSRELARADLKLRVGEYIIVMLLSAAGCAAIAWYLGGKPTTSEAVIPITMGLVVGFFLPRFYVGRMKNRRLQRFDEQLGDMLSLMVNSLRAGRSAPQAIEAVAKELPPPISDEFLRVNQEMQIGLTMETALENLLRRIPSQDLDLVVTAMNVQREVGGALADILNIISETIRERVRIKGEIRSLAAQQMISGRVLSILPILLVMAMYFLNKEYMSNFYRPETRFVGIPALIIAGIMILTGYNIMKKIADIEV